jgi:hypothetical protein
MDKSISKGLRSTFLVHMIIAAVCGAALLLVPGRTLSLVGWVPSWVQLPESDLSVPGTTFVDPVITRVLGAALLAMAFSSYRSWRAHQWGAVALLVQLEVTFCVLGALVILAGMFTTERAMPFRLVSSIILAGFALAWGLASRR